MPDILSRLTYVRAIIMGLLGAHPHVFDVTDLEISDDMGNPYATLKVTIGEHTYQLTVEELS